MSAVLGSVAIRPETPADRDAIRTLLLGAFAGAAEATLVDRLRGDGDMMHALVAAGASGTVVGHVAFSRLHIETIAGEWPAIALAPLAVAAPHRRRGIAAALVGAGMEQLGARGERIVFVVGDPDYYGRFGFQAEAACAFTSRYAGPHFLALALALDAPRHGVVRYAAAFDELA